MAHNSKRQVYGKRKRPQEKLEDAFASLTLESSSPERTQKDCTPPRLPLRSISPNAGPKVELAPPEEHEKVVRAKQGTATSAVSIQLRAKSALLDPADEVSALTSLEHVKDEVHDFGQACKFWAENYIISKIAQGGFAAIFRLQLRSDMSKYIVAKLMPLKPKTGKGSRAVDRTSIQDAATEVKALDAMSEIPGFVAFSEAWVLKGALPALFKKEYQKWAKSHPEDGFTGYSKDQLWCFIEMSDAGTDLEQILQHGIPSERIQDTVENARHLTASQCWDIFWGTAEALGRGEEFSEFEHRDLHPGNVCTKKTALSAGQMEGLSLHKRYTDLEVTLIDYSLSRATLANGEVLANSMRDQSLFDQVVDNPCTHQEHNDNQQYEMYRTMREIVVSDSLGCKDEAERWRNFVPQTNILWLYHVLSILVNHTKTNKREVVERSTAKFSMDRKRADLVMTNQSDIREDHKTRKVLEDLMRQLDPKQGEGCDWGSAKALLECEEYWTVEARKHIGRRDQKYQD